MFQWTNGQKSFVSRLLLWLLLLRSYFMFYWGAGSMAQYQTRIKRLFHLPTLNCYWRLFLERGQRSRIREEEEKLRVEKLKWTEGSAVKKMMKDLQRESLKWRVKQTKSGKKRVTEGRIWDWHGRWDRTKVKCKGFKWKVREQRGLWRIINAESFFHVYFPLKQFH